MSTQETVVTVTGWVGKEPRYYPGTEEQRSFTTFRMASTRRIFDREQRTWTDGRTVWFTVKTWRAAARNVAESLRKGDPVVVTGRLVVDEWAGEDGERTELVVEATALGHDLTQGTSRFARVLHGAGLREGDVAGDGTPVAGQQDPDGFGAPGYGADELPGEGPVIAEDAAAGSLGGPRDEEDVRVIA